jgi:phage shock protein PspC (stress-responsive transcriptional regulator)
MNTDTVNQQDTTTQNAGTQNAGTQNAGTQHDTGSDQRHQPPFQLGPERIALRRPFEDRMLTGVAAGLGRYLGIDTTIIRIAFVVLTLVGGAGIPLYLAGLLLIPDEGSDQSIASSIIGSFQHQ